MLSFSTIAGDCNSFNPVCGTNGVTYANACQCRELKIDVGYPGPCLSNARIEWVKRPEESNKNIKYWSPVSVAQLQTTAIPLKWADYSWETPGWNDQPISGFQPSFNNWSGNWGGQWQGQ